jgi:iron complex transport system substrate-binding protein
MKKKLCLFMLLAVFSVILAACGSNPKEETASSSTDSTTEEAVAEEITVTHELGETNVQVLPEKVVVFDMGTLDTLDKFGVEVAAVPHDGLPEYLSQYKDTTENAGGLKEPDFEKIAEIAPDLIIISGRQTEAYEELSKIAPTIYLGVDTTRYMESFKENVKTLGEIFGKEEEASQELTTIEEEINSLKESVDPEKTGLIVLASGGKISAFGPDSRFGLIHDVFGVTAVDTELEISKHGQSISNEYIVEKNPDYLFVVDRDAVTGEGSTAQTTVENDLVKQTTAYKEGNVIYLDPNYWYLSGGGLESVEEMVKEIQEGIN